ncbi:LacI family DNA-binding transcriptional regulator [Coraliomargarita sp. SDUM461004]|uniref:LacI family DNA-binding transcriptional regulator n=1 Tax=Thalassobacterium sedimentorum TaxID=3041258 RepID=A0ABU1ADN6_9BACT|nr:LacI family DNA-binding transcriptional regulator [Coraliomargarita sp. SDUM461004]MDQ8192819.1 LacI family DNA-binding transcriptional regulator [Coraliomargarita sp. SDUM461004]
MHHNAPSKKINMAYVAKMAKVHQGTVSRALRNDPRITVETRERIQKLADELGYRPNPLVSALIAEKRKGSPSGYGSTIAFLTSGETKDQWHKLSPQYAVMREHLQRHAYKRGYNLEDFWLHDTEMPSSRLRQILHYRGILGVIVCPLQGSINKLDFDFEKFASVAIGYTLRDPILDHVAIDYYSVMQKILARLIQNKSFKRIGFTTPASISSRVQDLSLSAYLGQKFQHPKRLLSPVISENLNLEASFTKWVQSKKPNVIICPTHTSYVACQNALEKMGLSVPRDISIVCADCHIDSSVSGILQDLDAEASAVIELLTSRMEHGIFGIPQQPQTIMVNGTWRDGDTLRATIDNEGAQEKRIKTI